MDATEQAERARGMWALGDYAQVAGRLLPGAEALVGALQLTADARLLDVAAGTGNVAAVAAARGARVTASDLAPRMVQLGRARTGAERLDVEWLEGDVEDLPFPDGSFDAVASAFGAIFAPRPELAVAEMARVTRPGGRVGLTSWTVDGLMGRMTAVMRRHVPGPSGEADPTAWGREEVARERLEQRFTDVACHRRILPWRDASPAEATAFLAHHSPMHVAALSALDVGGRAGLLADLEAFFRAEAGPAGAVDAPAEYLVLVGTRRT